MCPVSSLYLVAGCENGTLRGKLVLVARAYALVYSNITYMLVRGAVRPLSSLFKPVVLL